VIEKIIQKDLRCGVSVSTANKVWPNLVMDYPCMLCSQYEQKLVDKIKWPALVQLKMDGMRFNAIIRNGTVEYRSRNGKELNLLGNLDKDFIILSQGVECVFDGELIVSDKGVILDRQTGNGILNKASKGTISDLEAHKIRATVWDVIPYNDFISGVCKVPYSTRINSLELMLERKPEKVSMVQSNVVNTIDDANVLFETYLADGQEGIILKDLNGIWEDKRTKSQIKFKGELECDLKCVGIQAGTGKYEGMMGALLLESEDGTVKVSVGSGFNDDHRTNIGDEVIGKIIAVKYNARITNKQGEQSLFLPVFLEVREDKDTADLNKDIK
jgi:ATP-dependent DNA ligase